MQFACFRAFKIPSDDLHVPRLNRRDGFEALFELHVVWLRNQGSRLRATDFCNKICQ